MSLNQQKEEERSQYLARSKNSRGRIRTWIITSTSLRQCKSDCIVELRRPSGVVERGGPKASENAKRFGRKLRWHKELLHSDHGFHGHRRAIDDGCKIDHIVEWGSSRAMSFSSRAERKGFRWEKAVEREKNKEQRTDRFWLHKIWRD